MAKTPLNMNSVAATADATNNKLKKYTASTQISDPVVGIKQSTTCANYDPNKRSTTLTKAISASAANLVANRIVESEIDSSVATSGSLQTVKVGTGQVTVKTEKNVYLNVYDNTVDQKYIRNGRGIELTEVNVFTKNQSVLPYTLISAPVVLLDASMSNNYRLTLDTNATLANATNATDGMVINIKIKQDSVGGRTLAFESAYKWPGGNTPILTATPNAVDFLSMYYDQSDSTWVCVLQKGFA